MIGEYDKYFLDACFTVWEGAIHLNLWISELALSGKITTSCNLLDGFYLMNPLHDLATSASVARLHRRGK